MGSKAGLEAREQTLADRQLKWLERELQNCTNRSATLRAAAKRVKKLARLSASAPAQTAEVEGLRALVGRWRAETAAADLVGAEDVAATLDSCARELDRILALVRAEAPRAPEPHITDHANREGRMCPRCGDWWVYHDEEDCHHCGAEQPRLEEASNG